MRRLRLQPPHGESLLCIALLVALSTGGCGGGSSKGDPATPTARSAREVSVTAAAREDEARSGEDAAGAGEAGRGEEAACDPEEATGTAPGRSCAIPEDQPADPGARNVLGGPLEVCGTEPLTGFRRSGRCETGPADRGVHVVCAEVTEDFLRYSKAQGNDLITPRPEWRFPGLEPGDRWCLCAARWLEALDGDVAPPVVLEATEDTALRYGRLETFESHATD
ncbi:MAG TPA: DUF2237 domain-containing protein [Polyangiaceae bacterium LLY-WYZ-14_1]|nr:DUF2237 domain-containing protein [Polyangiaceae bacterium LLY-WYZ-14_1]